MTPRANREGSANVEERDILREKPLRYLGYANEVGESFRALWPVKLVWATYAVASSYVLADGIDKGIKANRNYTLNSTRAEVPTAERSSRVGDVTTALGDTVIWQSLASVIIPGFTINRTCAVSLHLLKKLTKLPLGVRKWTTTAIGLGMIPFIITPIDKSVDWMMDRTIRTLYYQIPPSLDSEK